MSRNNDDTTGNLLDFLYYQNYYRFNGQYLSRQIDTAIPQKDNFITKLQKMLAKKCFYC